MRQTVNRSKLVIALLAIALVAGLLFQAAEAVPNAPIQMAPLNFSDLADKVSPAVVHIKVEKIVKNWETPGK